MEVMNKFITIKRHIEGAPQESDFELKTESISLSVQAGSNDVIVKTIYLSIDPYQLNRMKSYSSSQKAHSFAVGIIPGEAIDAFGLGRVVASGHPGFENDDLVAGVVTWGEYSVIKGAVMLNKLDTMGFPLSYHVGIFGFSGLTAYGGFFKYVSRRRERKCLSLQLLVLWEIWLVSMQSCLDAMLSAVLEPNKRWNCLKRSLVLMMHSTTKKKQISSQLSKVFNMNTFGRVAVCGVISEYTDVAKRATPDMLDVIYKRITIQGFLAADQMNVYADFLSTTADHLHNGKMEVLEDISHGVESIPTAFMALFSGDNIGKKIVQIVVDV